jgi:CheY-like chemotaxis protein
LLEHLNHELRSPMTVIVGMTDLLLLRPLDDEPRQCLQSVKRAADVLLRMLDEAVDLSRLETGTLALGETEFTLAGVIERVREAIGSLSLDATIDESASLRLIGDADRLTGLIVALARSATKFRSAAAYKLCIAAEPVEQGQVVLHLALGDRERPFEATEAPLTGGRLLTLDDFFQGGFFGAGLGLPVAAGVAELMRGGLWMADDASSPALFRCSAQFALADSQTRYDLLEAVEERLAVAQRLAEPSPARSMHVLLVEDTAANRQFFASVLEQRGHMAVGVGDGQQALAAFQSAERPFDLALIDLEMPVMDGRQTAHGLRQLDVFKNRPIPLVALTAHRTDDNGELLRSGLFDAAVSKPCELAHFYDVVEGRYRGGPTDGRITQPVGTNGRRVDRRGTLARLGGNEQLFQDLARFFLEDAPTVLAELGTSLERDDARVAERAAHSLKGLVGNFGAKEAGRLATELQRLGHDGDLTTAPPLYQRLETEVNLLRRELEEYQASAAQARAPSVLGPTPSEGSGG